jgi:predicted lipoprotein with Yx(FWY)xxD motif
MRRSISLALGLPAILGIVAACSTGTGATAAPTQAAPVTAAPVTAAPATAAPATAAPTAEAMATVEAKDVGDAGTILVAGSNGLTLYNFTKDVKDSGESNCNEGCIDSWPALTVAGGGAPTGGSGVTGTLATITRDDGTVQVTYNGLPLYFFKNDNAPGDLNGVYENWETVAP